MNAQATGEIDDVTTALCQGCAVPFMLEDGWQGYCPSCCALSDEHLEGRHHLRHVPACRHCLESGGVRLRATA